MPTAAQCAIARSIGLLLLVAQCATSLKLRDQVESYGPNPGDDDRKMRATLKLVWKKEGSFKHSSVQAANRSRACVKNRDECQASTAEHAAGNCGGLGCRLVFVGDVMERASRTSDHIISEDSGDRVDITSCYDSGPRRIEPYPKAGLVPDSWRPLIVGRLNDQTHHTLAELERSLPALKNPEVFFVMTGTANLGVTGRYSAKQTAEGVEEVVRQIHLAHPGAKVLLHPILPRGEIQDAVDETNVYLKGYAQAADSKVEFVDCGNVFPPTDEVHQLLAEGYKLNSLGLKKWFSCLRPSLAHALGESTPDAM